MSILIRQTGILNVSSALASILNSAPQQVSITITAGNTSNTATISSVNTSNSIVLWQGSTNTTGTGISGHASGQGLITLTNSTTVTVSRTGSSQDMMANGVVLEFIAGAVTSIQSGTITMASTASSNTATISAVGSTAVVIFRNLNTDNSGGSLWDDIATNVELTNSTTVTATRASTTGTVTIGYTVLELSSTYVQSAQQVTGTASGSTSTTTTATISSVTTGNSIVFIGGYTSSITGRGPQANFLCELTNSTTVTWTRGGTNAIDASFKAAVLEFKTGVVNSKQSGTIDISAATSNTATISSVNTSKAFCNYLGNSVGGAYDTGTPNVTLTNATTVTATLGASGTTTAGYSVMEFV